MKRILFDLTGVQPNASGKMHGGGKYGIVMFKEMIKHSVDLEAVYYSSKYMPEEIKEACSKIKMHDLDKVSLESVLDNGNYDIYYSAMLSYTEALKRDDLKVVGSVHGLRRLEMPNDSNYLYYRQTIKSRLRVIYTLLFPKRWRNRVHKVYEYDLMQPNFHYIAVSNHTKASLLTFFPELKEKSIKVFYSPSTAGNRNIEPYSIEKYFLLVSANRPEKNALRAVQALDELMSEREEFKNYKVYLTGAKANAFKYKIKNPNNFEFLGYVPELDLARLYKGAFCFIYPSLNEGFGYPPLEAMNYGIPVLASPISSITEVCGDAVLYFNPFDYKEIKNRILQIHYDKNLYQNLKEKGVKRFDFITKKQNADLVQFVDWICEL